MIRFLDFPTENVQLADDPQAPEQVHVFDKDSVDAVNAALAAKRPLLVRGEPGTGKTQLAAAVARKLERAFVSLTVDIRTESRDLLWRFDAVRRLAQAQLVGALREHAPDAGLDLSDLEESRFVAPGPLWWGFHWGSAAKQAQLGGTPIPELHETIPRNADGVPDNGCVVLIDEIDKGETDVPNGLLEALGSSSFPRFGTTERVTVDPARPAPLVIVTTNEERTLPEAFRRRCLLLDLQLPTGNELVPWLVKIGEAHFSGVRPDLLTEAAEMLEKDRAAADLSGPRPGQAEFLDTVRAVREQAPDDQPDEQTAVLTTVQKFILHKHVDARL